MQAFIGATLLTSKETQPQSKPFEIYDSRLPGFTLRVQPSGVRSYYARFGRNRRVVLGKVGTLAPDEARERCQKVLGNFAHCRHPLQGIGGTDGITLGIFIADTYTTWVKASRPRTAANTLEKLHRHFRTWYPEPLTAITVERIESWKARRLNAGRSAATVLRDLFTLSSVLRRAVRKCRIGARRQERHQDLLPRLTHFGDHLTPAVLLSMNTGLRRGEVLKLLGLRGLRPSAPHRRGPEC